MSTPQHNSDEGCYGRAFQAYWDAGWRGILPLPAGRKKSPPDGFTGYSGGWPSYPDIYQWAHDRPGGNICLRLPPDVIGIDIDAYGDKTGGRTLEHAEALWGPLPGTVRTTSRLDPISGIRLYRVPQGTILQTVIRFPSEGLGNIEIIQYSHRYAVVWPSIHPDPDEQGRPRMYRWLDHLGFFLDDVPDSDYAGIVELPPAWLEALCAAAPPETTATDAHAALAALPGGEPDPAVLQRLQTALAALRDPSGSRHDLTLGHVLGLLRLAEQGHTGVRAALGVLEFEWTRVVTADESRSDFEARAEFERMVTGSRGHALIAATPTPDYAARNRELEELAGLVEPPGFWEARPELAAIKKWAHARIASPWAVLGAVLQRVSCLIPPTIVLPPVIGGRGSLNLIGCLVGPSGIGKGAAIAVAEACYPGPRGVIEDGIFRATIGSAEGIAHMFKRREKGVIEDIRNAVWFVVPEVDTLKAIGQRSGSALLPSMRDAYDGSDLSFSWANAEKRLPMAAHSYRLNLLIGVQPTHAGWILGDETGGFPQRCYWMPCADPTIPDERPQCPPPLPYLPGREWSGGVREVTLPPEVADIIVGNQLISQRGGQAALDGHALFTREKIAYCLAVLCMRTEMTIGDWELAGQFMDRSNQTRAGIERSLATNAEKESLARGRSAGVMQLAQDEVVTERHISKIQARVEARLTAIGGPVSRRELSKKFDGPTRKYFAEALDRLIRDGRVIEDGRMIKFITQGSP